MLSVSSAQLELWLTAFLWPFVRLLALASTAPILSHRSVPVRVKIGFAAAVALAIAPGLPGAPAQGDWGWLLAQQLAVGFAMGFALQVLFAAFEVAGELLGLQLGLSYAAFIDPQNGQSTPLVGSFLGLLAMLVFLAINGHLVLISGLAESFHVVPVGAAMPGAADFGRLAALGGEMFRIGVHLALPVLTTMLIINFALGVLARTAPQLNIFAVGFPATLLAGLLALALVMPLMGSFLESTLESGLSAALAVLR
jgi:flagellar biosynthetic protein FliR